MDEVKRLAYLQAMGTDTYVSLHQLPGAAVSRRLAIVRTPPPPAPQILVAKSAVVAGQQPAEASAPMPGLRVTPAAASAPLVPADKPSTDAVQPRFSLAAVSCGGWLWLEELEHGPLAPEQLHLLQAMAGALGLVADREQAEGRPKVTQFDWPIHTNRQLDLGQQAARSSAAGFIQRKLDQLDCRGLVLLGPNCETRVALDQLECARLVRTLSTGAMLRDPLLKKQAWRDLRSYFQRA